MTQEEKQLLLVDLSARLPYGVIVSLDYRDGTIVTREMGIGSFHDMLFGNAEGKPYLRPMSSMAKEERKIYAKLLFADLGGVLEDYYKSLDYLNSIHIDYRGLIERELAIAVTEDNNPYK